MVNTQLKTNKVTNWEQLANRINQQRRTNAENQIHSPPSLKNSPLGTTSITMDDEDRKPAERSYLDDIIENRHPVWRQRSN